MTPNSKRYLAMQSGFTLIELMIVIAIIGILASIALPTYQDYTVRTRIVEAMTVGSAVKTKVIENIASNGGAMPADACTGFTNITTATNNVATVECEATTGEITVLTTAKAGAVTFTLAPTITTNGVSWTCSADIAKYVPAGCR